MHTSIRIGAAAALSLSLSASASFADIKIAFIDPLSGPFASTGTNGLHQFEYAAETLVNANGGVLGGISTGQDIIARLAIKPTSSILTEVQSVTRDGEEVDVRTKGRHDPCVGIRAVPVAEAMMACVLLDQLLIHRGQVGA